MVTGMFIVYKIIIYKGGEKVGRLKPPRFRRPCSGMLLTALDLSTLKSRSTRAKLIMMYKIMNVLVNVPTNYFIPCHPQSRRIL